MKFNFDNERPIYLQLVEELKIAIISGKLTPGSKLPSVRELAIIAHVNPNTLQKALSELEDDKLIYTERTNGKYVTKDEKLIQKYKIKLAKELVLKCKKDLTNIGITFTEAVSYLQEIGEEK